GYDRERQIESGDEPRIGQQGKNLADDAQTDTCWMLFSSTYSLQHCSNCVVMSVCLGIRSERVGVYWSTPAISCTSIAILRRRVVLSIRMNALISLKQSESETKSSIWAIDKSLPISAPSKKNATGT